METKLKCLQILVMVKADAFSLPEQLIA